MPNDKRVTQMFISRQERQGKGAPQFINKLRPIDEEATHNLKRPRQDNDRLAKVARTDIKRPKEISKSPFPSNQGELYKDQYKGNITLLDLGGEVNVVQKRGSSEYFTARRLHKDDANDVLIQLNEMRHESLIAAIEVFTEGDNIYIVAEKMLLSLEHIVRSPPIPSAEEIGTIMGQILDGLVYLHDKGFVHGTLNCLSVLINECGNVKLTTHKVFAKISPSVIARDIEGVTEICMALMQKYKLDIGKVGVGDVADFLSSTTSGHGAMELRQTKLISRQWNPTFGWPRDILRGLVLTAKLTVPRNFRHSKEAAFS